MKKKMSSKSTASHRNRISWNASCERLVIDCIVFSTSTLHYDIVGDDVGLFVGDDVIN